MRGMCNCAWVIRAQMQFRRKIYVRILPCHRINLHLRPESHANTKCCGKLSAMHTNTWFTRFENLCSQKWNTVAVDPPPPTSALPSKRLPTCTILSRLAVNAINSVVSLRTHVYIPYKILPIFRLRAIIKDSKVQKSEVPKMTVHCCNINNLNSCTSAPNTEQGTHTQYVHTIKKLNLSAPEHFPHEYSTQKRNDQAINLSNENQTLKIASGGSRNAYH